MESQQHKASRNMKNKRNMIPPREHNNFLVITPKDMKICYLLNKEFKITVLKLSTLQKETRQLNEIRKTMHEQNKFNKELEIEKENQWVRWKKCNRNHRHQNRSSRRICELEDRVFEVIQSETPKRKVKKAYVIYDTRINLWIIGVLEGEQREKEANSLFKQIRADNFLNLEEIWMSNFMKHIGSSNKLDLKLSKIKDKGES